MLGVRQIREQLKIGPILTLVLEKEPRFHCSLPVYTLFLYRHGRPRKENTKNDIVFVECFIVFVY